MVPVCIAAVSLPFVQFFVEKQGATLLAEPELDAFASRHDEVVVLASVVVVLAGGVESEDEVLFVAVPLVFGLLPGQITQNEHPKYINRVVGQSLDHDQRKLRPIFLY